PSVIHHTLHSFPTRRSSDLARRFSGESIPLSVLSSVLYYSGGVTRSEVDSFGITWGFRCSPSGGALCPIDLFCFSLNVEECEDRSEEHTSELQSRENLVCRL